MKIAIFGSTGALGIELTKQAMQREWEVHSFARSPHPLTGANGVFHVQGDVLDRNAVLSFLQRSNCDVLISALGVKLGRPAGDLRSKGTEAIVCAAISAGMKRIVAVSAVGVPATHAQQTCLSRLMLPIIVGSDRLKEAQRQELVITSSGIEHLIVRAPRLVNAPPKDQVTVASQMRVGFSSTLSRVSLSKLLLDQAPRGSSLSGAVTAKDSA